jgi:hypothetical protein
MSGADNMQDVKRESTGTVEAEYADVPGVVGCSPMSDSGYGCGSEWSKSTALPIEDHTTSVIFLRCKIEPKSEDTSSGIAGIHSRHSSESFGEEKIELGLSEDGDEKPPVPRSETTALGSPYPTEEGSAYRTEECNICHFFYEPLEITRLGCGHSRCDTCLRKTFRLVTKAECPFPARCCGESIPLLLAAELLSPVELEEYHATRLQACAFDPIYCISSECKAFIPREHRNCGYATCPACQETFHQADGEGWPDRPSAEGLLRAEIRGWRRCYRCYDLVERQFGNCNYMQ